MAGEAWKKAEKVPSELLQLTYGCFVAQLWEDANLQRINSNDTETAIPIPPATKVNGELFDIGKRIGLRMADDFIAQMSLVGWEVGHCKTSSNLADVISLICFPLYLNIRPPIIKDLDDSGFLLSFPSPSPPPPNATSPHSRSSTLTSSYSTANITKLSLNDCNIGCGLSLKEDPIVLPTEAIEGGLHYAEIICGLLVGSLDAIGKKVDCQIISDPYLLGGSTIIDKQHHQHQQQHLEIRLSLMGRRSPLPPPADN